MFYLCIILMLCTSTSIFAQDDSSKSLEVLPVISYDSNTGFGYGAKAFFLNQFEDNESFDVILFNSTKGERWYRLVFSIPDFELRHGKKYPFALDIVADYDKWISSSYFGKGNNSSALDEEVYTKEICELDIIAGMAFSTRVVLQAGLKYRNIANYNLADISQLKKERSLSSSNAGNLLAYTGFRFDSRNSFINPTNGFTADLENEWSFAGDGKFLKTSLSIRSFTPIILQDIVLALRSSLENNSGKNLPVQFLGSLGGNRTLRGFSQDRFIDYVNVLFNAEIRFPFIWRFGGIAGIDAGRVWHSFNEIGIGKWKSDFAAGLRFYMDTFIVRLDAGFSKEGTEIFFNFGQVF